MHDAVRRANDSYNWLDKKLKQAITGHDPDTANLADLEKDVRGHFATRGGNWSEWPIYSDIFGVIDGKASALLTHISLMIAIIAIMAAPGISAGGFIMGLLQFLLLPYIAAAYLCLRCLRFWSFTEVPFAAEDAGAMDRAAASKSLKIEIYFRQEAYKLALNLTSVLTIISVLFLFLSYLG